MIATFYQRLLPINKLIRVGQGVVPDDTQIWFFPTTASFVYSGENIFDETFYVPQIRSHQYNRIKTALGDMFVANVEVK